MLKYFILIRLLGFFADTLLQIIYNIFCYLQFICFNKLCKSGMKW